MKKTIIMAVYGPIQSDARVIRAAKSLNESNFEISIISLNSDERFSSSCFSNVFLKSKRKYISLFYFWIKVIRIAIKDKADLLYLHDYYMPFAGKIYKILTGKKWIYDAHELIIVNKAEKSSLRMRFFAYLERISIQSASLVIAANNERLMIMKNKYNLKNSIAIQNISDYKLPNSSDISQKKDSIIVYQGAIISSRHIDFYLRSHKLLPKEYILLLIGDGDSREKLETTSKELGLSERVIFTGKVTQSELYNYSRKAKIGIITYPLEGLNNYYCAPNKIFEYAALKIPMIGTSQPFLRNMFEKYHIGEIVEWDDTESYLKAVNKIVSNYDSYLAKMDDFLKENSWEKESEKLQKSLIDILS